MPGKKKKNNFRVFLVILSLLIFIALAVTVTRLYQYIYEPNVYLRSGHHDFLYIPTGSDYEKAKSIIFSKGCIINKKAFEWVARKKSYPGLVKPGRYKIENGMSNNELINLLRSGKQSPVRVIFQNIRTPQELAGKISRQLEIDSAYFFHLLQDKHFLEEFGVTPATVFVLFIPDTYEFYWNTTPEQFMRRMNSRRMKFWNTNRSAELGRMGFTALQAITLASIVEKETSKDSEKPAIAGVYINRLKKGWPLQADPTLIYAWNDYSIRRVLDKHKLIDSPYNTYSHCGLPPGPICLPSVSSIEAVLNHAESNYMFFCAKDDLSGYHNFSTTLAQHTINARKYQEALRKLNIRQ